MSLLEKNVTYAVTWVYTYDDNGNLETAEYQNGSLARQYKWAYTWNPKNQMTLAEKFGTTDSSYAGKVAYAYCLSCDGALSQRIEYTQTTPPTITSWKRYEYDGLNLLRVDERYDSAGGTIDDTDNWRMKELATHKPGSLGNMLGKKVYNYNSTNYTDTPTSSAFYAYHYDAVGNLLWVTDLGGVLSHSFTQDAFGNALATGTFSGSTWSTARTAGIIEHQTGKWIDPFTGLYFFHARWYDSTVGRFVGRDPYQGCIFWSHPFIMAKNNPQRFIDPSGNIALIVSQHGGADCGCTTEEMDKLRININNSCSLLYSILLEIVNEGDVTQEEVRDCLKQFCNQGTVWCQKDCLKPYYCGVTYNIYEGPGKINFNSKVVVCPNRTNNPGATAIHEFGHACGCTHPENKPCDGHYVSGRSCGFLPCGSCNNGNNKGF